MSIPHFVSSPKLLEHPTAGISFSSNWRDNGSTTPGSGRRGGIIPACAGLYRMVSQQGNAADRGMAVEPMFSSQKGGGRGGIRTLGGNNPTFDFESSALNRTQPPFLKTQRGTIPPRCKRSSPPEKTALHHDASPQHSRCTWQCATTVTSRGLLF